MKTYVVAILTGIRLLVGWHFLYEGIHKLMTPGWTAKFYLLNSKWIFSDVFHAMAQSDGMIILIDFFNSWGLLLIGISLILGLLYRWASIVGAVLLLFYFVAYPPIPGYDFGNVAEGNYLWVNKNLIELVVLTAFVFLPRRYFFSIDRLFQVWREERAEAPIPAANDTSGTYNRRKMLRELIGIPVLGAFAYALYKKNKWDSYEEKFLSGDQDALSGATLKNYTFTTISDLQGKIPTGKIGDLEMGRLIMGGNLIGGWAHARDLIYASKLVKAYHTDERIINTFQLAENCGVNAIITNPALARIMNKYWHETDGRMKFISDCGSSKGFMEGIQLSQEAGAAAMYCQGGIADRLTYERNFDEIRRGLDLIHSYGKPAGIGAHRIETIKACVEQGIKPDFWVKTLHHHNYWSAEVDPKKYDTVSGDFKDNIFCFKPQETIDFMNQLEEPWIAFKILAAGAIHPKDAFSYAFNSGADFICVGMYDFQIVEDCNIALDSLANTSRMRPWRA